MRKGMAQGLARPAFYDRNPINRTQAVNTGNVAPHALTTRWTYTVPAGKKAFLDTANVVVQRQTAAAPVGIAAAQIVYTPSGGSAATLTYAAIATNGAGDTSAPSGLAYGAMLAGDVVVGQDVDLSTGGLVVFQENGKILEYDA